LNCAQRLQKAETVVNLGTRIGLTGHATLLAAIGRDTSNTMGPRISLLSYLAVQIAL
jgi:hypothetical protein